MARIKTNQDFTKNRSDKYQHVIMESPCEPKALTEFSDARRLNGLQNYGEYDEEYFELQDKLRQARWRIIKTKLTPRQREVIELCAAGKTQTEIASMLDVNQSSVTKSINGNCDYKNGKRVYGGAKKKARKMAELDPEIQEILESLSEMDA